MKIDIKAKEPYNLESAYAEAPFDKAKKELKSNGYEIITLEQNAQLRMQEGKDAFISRNGNYTKEGVIYLPSKEIYLTKNSPIIKNAEKATNCHRKGNEFYLTKKQIDKALEGAVKFSRNSSYEIPTNEFKNDEIIVYAFGDSAEKYGNFLKEAGIKAMPVWLADCEKKPFARQMWFGGLGGNSGLNGNDRYLNGGGARARGVRFEQGAAKQRCTSAEGASQNARKSGISGAPESRDSERIQTYTLSDTSKALKEANLSGIEKVLLEKLKK